MLGFSLFPDDYQFVLDLIFIIFPILVNTPRIFKPISNEIEDDNIEVVMKIVNMLSFIVNGMVELNSLAVCG